MIKIHPKRKQWLMKRLGWVLGGLLLLIVVLGAIRYKQKSLVSEVRIQIVEDKDGTRFVSEEDVRDVLFNTFGHYLEGQTLEKVNVQATEKALENDPFIEKADVYVDALNKINIQITQRKPILRVLDSDDASYYLDAKGGQIPFSNKYSARVVVVSGNVGVFAENYLEIEDNRLRKVYNLVKELQKNQLLSTQIEQIHVELNGEVVMVPKLGSHKIYFGEPSEDIEDKFKRLETFYREGLSYEGWEKYKSISLAFKGQVVAKKH